MVVGVTFLKKGFIEYIDPQEEETIMICMTINVNKMVLVGRKPIIVRRNF